jgi:choline dehydrogenase
MAGKDMRKLRDNGAFDFVVVGAGSAGCLLAARLADGGRNSVCLLEAGRKGGDILYDLPMLAGRLYLNPKNNWSYHTVPQPGLNGRKIFLPRGRKVGGSFIFNGAQYIRGNRSDYDQWAQMGNKGWSYEEVLPYFKRSEKYLTASASGFTNGYHGLNGHLAVGKPENPNVLTQAFLQACSAAGFPLNDDFNGPRQEGFGLYDFNISDGRRCTTRRAFLDPAVQKGHVTLVPNAEATRLLFQGDAVDGVEYQAGDTLFTVRARREVVLTAGAMNTPKLLMLSGIGNAEHLSALGIETRRHLPGVGENFMDHINVAIFHKAKEMVSLGSVLRWDRFAAATLNTFLRRRGPLSQSALEAGGFFSTRPGLEAPDCQAVFVPIPGTAAKIKAPWAETLDDHGFLMPLWPNRPVSRGRIALRSANPRDDIDIDPRFMSYRDDLETTREAVKIGRRILATAPLDRYRGIEVSPGKDVVTDDEIEAFIRENGKSGHHACGTAKMGVDAMSVVDNQLRVHGMRNLRIADASVTPTIVTGNTNAVTIMVAERASDFALGRAPVAGSVPA